MIRVGGMSEGGIASISGVLGTGRHILAESNIPQDDVVIESRLLLQHVTGMTVEEVIGNSNEMVGMSAIRDYLRLVRRRSRHRQPLAYILGEIEFYRREFFVEQGVLIPRPETEMLVTLALDFASDHGLARPSVCDLGTGSGVLAVSVALELGQCRVTACDISPLALKVATRNAERYGVAGRIDFRNADMTSATIGDALGRFDIVVANPPYVPTARLDQELEPEVSQWEPRLALDGGPDGMKVLGPLIDRIPKLMRESGPSLALIEIDNESASACLERATHVIPDTTEIKIIPDDAGLNRILAIERSA